MVPPGVFGAPARIGALALGRDDPRARRDHGVQLYQRGIADELTDVPGDPHASIVSGPAGDYQVASRMYSPICLMDRLASDTAGAPSWKTCI